MARTENDSWDLASGVGTTATMVAVARALATAEADPLISDPFAGPLVRAVGIDFFTGMLDGTLEPAVAAEAKTAAEPITTVMAVRTRFFDDFFDQAAAAGIRQAVILAAGLDSRAYRLAWPPGSAVYEIDQPEVIEFKTSTLAGLGARPTADRRPVAVDLRDDWPDALRRNGFDETKPTAWSAEGLLIYLPRRPKTGCSTTSPRSARRAAGWPPSITPTAPPRSATRPSRRVSGSQIRAWISTWPTWSTPASDTRSGRIWASGAGR